MILERIAKTIRKSGLSRYKISKDTGVEQSVLCKIVTGSGSCSCGIRTADKLCKYLGLELVPKGLVSKKRKRKAR